MWITQFTVDSEQSTVNSSQFTVGNPHQRVLFRVLAENGERRTENGKQSLPIR